MCAIAFVLLCAKPQFSHQPPSSYNNNHNFKRSLLSSSAKQITLPMFLNGSGFGIYSTYNVPHFGSTISTVGDINGDTIPDFFIGTDNGVGQLVPNYVLFGRNGSGSWPLNFTLSSLNRTDGLTFSVNTISTSGKCVTSIKDFNGDGIPDFAVADLQRSIVSIIFGKKSNTFPININILSLNAIGISVLGINFVSEISSGDFNGDGLSDIAVGASFNTSPVTKTVFVAFGSKITTKNISVSALNGTNGFSVNFSVKPVGRSNGAQCSVTFCDINNDGFSDLITAPYSDSVVYVIFGKNHSIQSVISTTAFFEGFTIIGNPSDKLGSDLSVGDFNGDKIQDVLIASVNAFSGNGSASVLFGTNYSGLQTFQFQC